MRHRNRDRGASLVEFALVLPLLATFLFGIVQFGLAYDAKQSINSAAREAARMAAIPDTTNVLYSDIVARADATFNGLLDGSIDDLTVEVINADTRVVIEDFEADADGTPCASNAGETVVVEATKLHDITIPFVGVRTVTLEGRGEFRCEIDA